MNGKDAEPELVASAERGLAVLAAFRPDQPAMTLSEVAKATGLDRASTRRFLHTLLARGYLRADGQQFRLHPAVLELGNAYLRALRLPHIAVPALAALVDRFNEPASMAVLEADQVVIVAHAPSTRLMAANVAVGARVPAYQGSLGPVLLAGKPDDWLAGYLTGHAAGRGGLAPSVLRADVAAVRRDNSFIADEPDTGIRSVAVPVRDRTRTTVAAIGISSHTDRVSHTALAETIRPALAEAARRIEQAYLDEPES